MSLVTVVKDTDLFNTVKPFLSGMSLSEMNQLIDKLNGCTYAQFEDWVQSVNNVKFSVFFNTMRVVLKEALD